MLGFAVVTMLLGAKMLTSEIIMLSGAYAITGLLMMAAGSVPPGRVSTYSAPRQVPVVSSVRRV